MGDAARISQSSVDEQKGVLMPLRAAGTYQTRHRPLQAHVDMGDIKSRSRPWKQMRMFFVRMQLQRGGQRTPEYKFTPEQFAAFNRLIEEAKGRQNDGLRAKPKRREMTAERVTTAASNQS